MLSFGGMKELKSRILAKSFQVSLVIRHLVKVVNGRHLEDLHVTSVLKACVRTARVHELTIAFLVALEIALELELVVLLLVVAEASVSGQLALRAAVCSDQHLLHIFGILGG